MASSFHDSSGVSTAAWGGLPPLVPVQNSGGTSILQFERPNGTLGGACGEGVAVYLRACVGFTPGKEGGAAGCNMVAASVVEGDQGAILDFGTDNFRIH